MSAFSRMLMFRVHGLVVKPARKPRRRVQRGPARNWKYRAWIRSLPCLVCGCTPSEAAHTGSDGGMRLKSSDYSCVPICTDCHTMRPDSYHRHPGGRAGFEQQHNLNIDQMVKFLVTEFKEGHQ